MKTFIKYILIILLAGTVSCGEEFLKEDIRHQSAADAVFPTQQGMESLINATYSSLRFWYGKEYSVSMTELGTDIFTNATLDYSVELANYTLVSTEVRVLEFWRYFYLALNNANTAIERLPKSALSPTLQKTREGEVRFLRALYLWHITEIWGGVHFTTSENKGAQFEAYRTPIDTFYSQIFRDLKIATTLLPVKQTQYGRVDKAAAQALHARMHLYRASHYKYGYDNGGITDNVKAAEHATLAAAYADSLINNINFKLLPNYADLWKIGNDEYSTNNEVIWSVCYVTNSEANNHAIPGGQTPNIGSSDQWPGRTGNNLHLDFLMVYDQLTLEAKPLVNSEDVGKKPVERDIANGRPFMRFMPTKFLVDLYNDSIDSRFDGSFLSTWFCNVSTLKSMALGDTACYVSKLPRDTAFRNKKKYVVYDHNDIYDSKNNNQPIPSRRFFNSLKKFMDPNRVAAADQFSGRDVYVLRLAEMYFIAAEAQMYLGDNQKAADYINVIRTRAAKKTPVDMTAKMQITAADINLDFLLDEKAREFAGEYIRWFDLKRTGTLISRTKKYNADCTGIMPYHIFRPIPQIELDAIKNRQDFTQNTGY